MKRLLIYLLCAVFLAAATGPVYAVEKKKVDKDKSTQVQKKTPGTNDSSSLQQQKKYDDFVDANHNGIDDRRENLLPKSDDTKPAPNKTDQKPATPDSTKKAPTDKK